MWKKNGNQIMLRCLLKHYKIRIFKCMLTPVARNINSPMPFFCRHYKSLYLNTGKSTHSVDPPLFNVVL